MAYKVLGMIVWNGAKFVLRRRYGSPIASKPVLAGGFLLAAAGVLLAARARSGGD